MRGLVFGQINREIDLSESRKRLRVEQDSLGRVGGAFVAAPTEILDIIRTSQRCDDMAMV